MGCGRVDMLVDDLDTRIIEGDLIADITEQTHRHRQHIGLVHDGHPLTTRRGQPERLLRDQLTSAAGDDADGHRDIGCRPELPDPANILRSA